MAAKSDHGSILVSIGYAGWQQLSKAASGYHITFHPGTFNCGMRGIVPGIFYTLAVRSATEL